MSPITVTPRPSMSPARVEVIWDPDIQSLYCRIAYPERTTINHESTPLRDMLDARWPLAQPRRMITAGRLSMVLDAEERLSDFDILINPSDRNLQSSPPGDTHFVQPYVHTPFDEHGDAKCPPIREELYDAEQGIFCLGWGTAHHWCCVAPSLALGLVADGSLMKIRLSNFCISAPKSTRETHMEQLRRKLGYQLLDRPELAK